MVSLEYKRDMQALFEQEGDTSSNDGTRKHFDYLLHTEHYNMQSDCTEVYQASHH